MEECLKVVWKCARCGKSAMAGPPHGKAFRVSNGHVDIKLLQGTSVADDAFVVDDETQPLCALCAIRQIAEIALEVE